MKKAVVSLFLFAIITAACSSSSFATPSQSVPNFAETNVYLTAVPTATKIPLPPTPTLISEGAFIKGITLNDQGVDLDTKYSYQVIDEYIIPSGANYVAVIPTCWSENMTDTNIVCANEDIPGILMGVSDTELVNTIKHLHSVGLRVVLKPQALIKTVHSTNQEPKYRNYTQSQWDAWFDSYTMFIAHYAQIAEENEVDLFVVGNEQEETTQNEQRWRNVISSVRTTYHGPITYAANSWGFEASNIKFWDALDYIGTNGYSFGKVNKNNSSIADMAQAWQPYLQQLEEMSQQYSKQVIITEIGARPVQGFNQGEVNDANAPPYDGQEQADFYAAFFEALKDKPWIKGIILWDINTDPLQGGPNDISYTFIGKPAEGVVRHYFGGSAIIPTPVPDFTEDLANSMAVYKDDLGEGWHIWTDPNAKIVPELHFLKGHEGAFSLRLPLAHYPGIGLDYQSPITMTRYKWLEFYVMVGEHQPKNLVVQFEYWTPSEVTHSRIALVNDLGYIEGGQFRPGTWQRVRIPLINLGIADQRFTGFGINNCVWPCSLDPNVDDVYIDDIQLVAGKSP